MSDRTSTDVIYERIEKITDCLAEMTKEQRMAWFREKMYVKPLDFVKEIDGTAYVVRTFFSDDARENITDKVQRLVLHDAAKDE